MITPHVGRSTPLLCLSALAQASMTAEALQQLLLYIFNLNIARCILCIWACNNMQKIRQVLYDADTAGGGAAAMKPRTVGLIGLIASVMNCYMLYPKLPAPALTPPKSYAEAASSVQQPKMELKKA